MCLRRFIYDRDEAIISRKLDIKPGLHSRMGGDGHGHGHGKMPMPDWRQWKVEGTPLEFTQQRLAARGLKDPWLR